VTGLLVQGKLVPVAGLHVIPPASHGGPAWATLDPGDYRARTTPWIRQVILHTTKGLWPQSVLPGAGPGGRTRWVAEFWRGDAAHSAAQLVVDTDGTVACLCDLVRAASYHAQGSNPWSVGIEMYQEASGGIYDATLFATSLLVQALCDVLSIPPQIPRGPYRGAPLARMETLRGAERRQLGGPDVVGVLGHRDNTRTRGRGDPGDEIWTRLAARGFEPVDYAAGEDLAIGRQRQAALIARGERLVADGLVGPASLAAARRQGFARWRDVR
jgi:hypothetical protein